MADVGDKKIVLLPQVTHAAAATTNNTQVTGITGYNSAILILNVTAQSGTTPTLDVYVQQEIPIPSATDKLLGVPTGTSVWDDLAHFTQVTTSTGVWVAYVTSTGNAANVQKDGALAAATVRSGPIGTTWRVKDVIGGTGPSYTFSVSAILIP